MTEMAGASDDTGGGGGSRITFSTVDYCVFVGMLLVSTLIGIYHAVMASRRDKQTTTDLLLGGRQMSMLPVSISIMASFLSAILILGAPSEMYTSGVEYWCAVAAFVVILPAAAALFVPIFYRCGLTSVNQYVQLRFEHSILRSHVVVLILMRTLCYMAIALYAPSLALSSTTSLSLEVSIVTTAAVATLYTTFGGLKAVVWADVLQALVMAAGLVAIVVQGAINVGGFENIFTISAEHQRLDFFNWNFSPWQRHNFWNVFFGTLFLWTSVMGADQAAVQRYLSLPSLSSARWACLLNAPANIFYMSLANLAGLAIFATYANCDPIKKGLISRKDQLVPYFVLDQMSYLTGLPGLFVACIMSGALSTVSSGLNSLATVTWTDFLSRLTLFQNMSDQAQSNVSKVLSFVYGLISVGLAFVAARLGGVLQASLAVNGALSGPVFGIFCLGIFVPFATGRGAMVGLYLSTIYCVWTVIGAYITDSGSQPVHLPTSIDGCAANLTSIVDATTKAPPVKDAEPADPGFLEQYIYSVSYTLYNLIGCLLCVVIGSVASLCMSSETVVDKSLVNPICYKLFGCGRVRHKPSHAADNPIFMSTYKQKPDD